MYIYATLANKNKTNLSISSPQFHKILRRNMYAAYSGASTFLSQGEAPASHIMPWGFQLYPKNVRNKKQ